MSSDQLEAHLEFFEELGVEGIRLEPELFTLQPFARKVVGLR